MNPRAVLFILLTIFGLVSSLGCHLYDCDGVDVAPVESGEYSIIARAFGPDEQQWLLGAQLTVDSELGSAILRYTRDGTTYEVKYTLEP